MATTAQFPSGKQLRTRKAPSVPVTKDMEIGGHLKARVKCVNTCWQVEIHRDFFVSNEQMTTETNKQENRF